MYQLSIQLIVFLFSQQVERTYSLLVPGNSWAYETLNGTFEDKIIGEKYIYKGIVYYQNVRSYADGTAEVTYYRKDKNGATLYLDNKTFKESIEIPANPILSYRWLSSDGKWTYKIIEVGTTLKTPKGDLFKSCIAIQAQSNDGGGTFLNYYAEGIGFVGSKSGGQLVAYLVKWNTKEQKT